MKSLFIPTSRYNTADVADNGGSEQIASKQNEKVYTSEKLTTLQASYQEAWGKMSGLTPGSKEANDAFMATFKIQKDIDAEIAGLKKADADKELEVKRNERIALNTTQLDAYAKLLTVTADKKATPEDKQAASDAFDAAKKAVENELLAKYAKSTPSASTATGATATGNRGEKGKQIVERFLAHRAEGKNDTDAIKAVIAEGFSRGTTGAVVLAWQRENGEKQ